MGVVVIVHGVVVHVVVVVEQFIYALNYQKSVREDIALSTQYSVEIRAGFMFVS